MGISNGQNVREIGLHLFTDKALELARFYRGTFCAEETIRIGSTACEAAMIGVRFANAHFTIVQSPTRNPIGHCVGPMAVYVPNADWVMDHALALGAELAPFLDSNSAQPVVNTPTGDRAGRFLDPAGFLWEVRTWAETMSADQVTKYVRMNSPHRL